jgi:hypothetical protein
VNEPLRYHGTIVSRGKIVPLISSYVAGPLGLIHLPRLWLKALLHAHDRLAEDWGCGPGGLDKIIMGYVGIDGGAFIPWLTSELPAYAACEGWVREYATNLNPQAIAESNARLLDSRLPGDLNAQFRAHLKIDDESIEAGITLNNLDDWDTVHRYALANRDGLEPIVPAISPLSAGLLGVPNLPRQWLKDILFALSALPSMYPLVDEPADALVLERLGIDPAVARTHVRDALPSYLEYERWLRERTTDERLQAGRREEETALMAAAATAHDTDWALLHAILAQSGSNEGAKTGVFAFSITPLVKR